MFPITTLGERIRKIRKDKKMTLETLAGTELTKGMLSLIENNKAQPSMESLNYIAERLGVDVSDLLESVNVQELRQLLEEVEKLYSIENENPEQISEKYQKIVSLIEPVKDKLTSGYEAARLLELYSYGLYYGPSKEDWHPYLEKAASLYEQMNITARRAKVGLFRALDKFTKHKYYEALELLLQERRNIEEKHSYIDSLTRLDFDYHEAILHFAVGDSDSAIEVIDSAIKYSKKHKVFYHIDDLYRIAVGYGLLFNDEDKINYYADKLKHYGEFAEDEIYFDFYDFVQADILIERERDYLKALQIIDKLLSKKENFPLTHYLVMKGKALYKLGKYEEAIKALESVKVPDYIHHPFDLSIIYIADSYKALSYMEKGDLDKALKFAAIAKENIDPLPYSSYKQFILDAYEKILCEIKKPL